MKVTGVEERGWGVGGGEYMTLGLLSQFFHESYVKHDHRKIAPNAVHIKYIIYTGVRREA